jgi:hypothetical protein
LLAEASCSSNRHSSSELAYGVPPSRILIRVHNGQVWVRS